MVTVNFTQFRQNARSYLDAVEKGETVCVKRHGKVIAEIIPPKKKQPSWKTKAIRLKLSGGPLSKSILKERRESL